jgi:hypothetical protein
LYLRKAKNFEVKQEKMMKKGKHQRIGKKPPETHNAKGRFGLIIKTFFLYGYADE